VLITMETTSMNKPSMITIRSSSAPIGLWPLLVNPPITRARPMFLWRCSKTARHKSLFLPPLQLYRSTFHGHIHTEIALTGIHRR
jgi:hypothetical protein